MPSDPDQHDQVHLADPHVATLLDRAAEELARHLGEIFSVETIRAVVQESYDLLDATARVRTYLPVLAGRFARERLATIAKEPGSDRDHHP